MRSLLALAVLLAAAACDDAPRPTSPTPQPGDPGAAPVARVEFAVDALGSRDAIVALSDVSVDARSSTGSGLTYSIDFGDGATATDALARHVYPRAGTFTITVIVRDSTGRTATASRLVVVKALTGRWFHAGYVERARRFELRYLTIDGQDGPVIRGSFRGQDQIERPFAGRLTGPRSVQIALDDQTVQLDGVAPGNLYEDGQLWTFQMRGGSVDGERLAFRPVIGEPTGTPPDAVLKIRFDSFGAAFPIQGLSPIQFDGSTSRGDGLTYFMEFGDGEVSMQPTAVHPINRSGQVSTRLTVVDRFGRADAEVATYDAISLVESPPFNTWQYTENGGKVRVMTVTFRSRDGLTLAGVHRDGSLGGQGTPFVPTPFIATLSGERDVRIVLQGSGIEYRGHIELHPAFGGWRMFLTQVGGPDHGLVWTFLMHPGP
jgi:hypothetical protein